MEVACVVEERKLIGGDIYRHFKNKLYQIVTVAKHSETGQELVIYQALYGQFGVYARPKEMFLSEVDHVKYPDVKQKYRFERVNRDSLGNDNVKADIKNDIENNDAEAVNKIIKEVNNDIKEIVRKDVKEEVKSDKTVSEDEVAGEINKDLLDFLNADSYKEKIDVLNNARKRIDDRTLDNMAVAMDYILPEGNFEDKCNALIQCLRTLEKYELKRR